MGEEKEEEKQEEKDEGNDTANYLMVRAVTMFQAMHRRIKARKDLVLQMQDQECLLAMPGTIQGRSGWYEYDEDGEAMVAQFDIGVAEDGDESEPEWTLVKGPMKLNSYTEALQIIRERGLKRVSTDRKLSAAAPPPSSPTPSEPEGAAGLVATN